jgi:WD40 repeat protein
MSRTLTVVIPRWVLFAVPVTMLGILAVAFFLLASGRETTRTTTSDKPVELSETEPIQDEPADESAKNSQQVSDQIEEDIKRTKAQNNLNELTLALHNYESVYKRLPIFATGSQGLPVKDLEEKPLLSWRVALLPYLDERELFEQFHLDEPWDSEHNKKLIPRMPKLFQSQTKPGKDAFTHLQMVIGPNAMTPSNRGIFSIVDGTSNTIAVVEAAEPVIWTKPADVMLAAGEAPQKDLRAKFGGQFTGGFFVSMWDGTIHFVEDSVSDRTLADAMNPADGKALGSDWKPKNTKSETIQFGNENGIPFVTFRAEPSELYNWAQFSRDGKRVIAGVGDRIRVWDAQTAIPECNIELPGAGYVTSCNKDGSFAVSLAGHKVVIWELNLSQGSGKRLVELKDYSATSAQISPDGKRLVTFTRGVEKQTARVWDTMTGKPLMELKNKGTVVSAEFHADGKLIATTCLYKEADGRSDYLKSWSTIWESKSGDKLGDGAGALKTTDLTGNLLLSNSESGSVELFSLQDMAVVREFKDDDGRIIASRAAINSSANRIVTAGEFLDETARVWSLSSPEQSFLLIHGDAVEFVDISPNGDRILTAGPSMIRIWSLK